VLYCNGFVQMSADEFNKFMHAKGVRREEDMKLLEDHIRQSFKVFACHAYSLIYEPTFITSLILHALLYTQYIGGKVEFGGSCWIRKGSLIWSNWTKT
jgi:hypothetical protein